MENSQHLEFCIGQEKRLGEIIGRLEVEPLLRSAVKAGLLRAVVLDEDQQPLCAVGDESAAGKELRQKLLVEGEPRGFVVAAVREGEAISESLVLMLRDALQLTLNNNLKRMLTTEVHTSVVQESYEQLVEANRSLMKSENRYRELALSLEKLVEERTVELQKAYSRLLQQEKLASVGQLAAGMAHEINNPTGFILSNLTTFQKYIARIKEMLGLFRVLASKDTSLENLRSLTEARWRELKLDFVLQDSEELLEQSLEGADRIKKIVSNLKSFSHLDEPAMSNVDLNLELKRTLTVVEPQLAPDANVVADLLEIPLVRCNPALICQVFHNVIQNSIQSRRDGLELRLETSLQGDMVQVTISDNGCGILPEHINRVFDPFFTTREVGSGTGMGLTMVREIVSTLGGQVELESAMGSGTTVTLFLPVKRDN